MDSSYLQNFESDIKKILNFEYEDNLLKKRNRKEEELQNTIKILLDKKKEELRSFLKRNKRG